MTARGLRVTMVHADHSAGTGADAGRAPAGPRRAGRVRDRAGERPARLPRWRHRRCSGTWRSSASCTGRTSRSCPSAATTRWTPRAPRRRPSCWACARSCPSTDGTFPILAGTPDAAACRARRSGAWARRGHLAGARAPRRTDRATPADQLVSVTLLIQRGFSVSRPRPSVVWYANSWAGQDGHDGRQPLRDAAGMARPAAPMARIVGSSEMTTRSTRYWSRSRSSSSRMPGSVAPVGAAGEHQVAGLDQRHRAVLEVGRGVRIRLDLGQLLELERPLPRRRVLEATAQHDAPVDRGARDGGPLHRRLPGQRRVHQRRQPAEARPARRIVAAQGIGRATTRWRRRASRPRAAGRCRSWSPRPPAPGRRRYR